MESSVITVLLLLYNMTLHTSTSVQICRRCTRNIYCKVMTSVSHCDFYVELVNILNVWSCLLFQIPLLLILLVLCRRIGVVIELFYEAAKCLTSVPVLLIQPLWLILIRIIFMSYWIVIYAYVITLGLFHSLCLIMAALCNRAGRYIFALWFLSSSVYFLLT